MYYVLADDGRTPVKEPDLVAWGRWLERGAKARTVAKTEAVPGVEVSTVFLGLDHRWFDGGPPLLFETMIFGGHHDGYQERCSTWEQAEEQHATALRLVAS